MSSPLLRLREASEALSPTERSVATQIIADPKLVLNHSVRSLAQQTFCSTATIVRLCNHIGYPGYRDFRQAVAYELAVRDQTKLRQQRAIERTDSLEGIIDKITYQNIVSLEETQELMDAQVLQRCVNLLHRAKVMYLFGMGASVCTAKDAYLKFLRANKLCVLNEDWHSQLLQARNATAEDVAIVLSYSGATVEMIECMKALKDNGTPTIAITRFLKSPVSDLADEKLYTASNEALFRTGAMASRISQLNIIDILYTALNNLSFDASLDQLSKTYIQKPNAEDSPEVQKTPRGSHGKKESKPPAKPEA